MRLILSYMWYGLWTGFGFEASFFILWLTWRVTHSKLLSGLHADHWIHEIHKYFE